MVTARTKAKEELSDCGVQEWQDKPKRSVAREAKVRWEDAKEEKVALTDAWEPKSEVINATLLPESPIHSPVKEESELADADSDQKRSSSSRQGSDGLDSPKGDVPRLIRDGPTQFATHLPRGEDKALQTFERLKGNWYQNSRVGRSKGHEKEAMVCECRYRQGVDDPMMACTEEADCINRLTQVECLKSECNCGQYCQNQRFERGQYADVEIVETEKKGFGLRAGSGIAADQFIYEYIGEVVEQKEFVKRMQQYRDESIRHFYFMMLQREEFLDATKRGGVARFVNHSCNPNCYVSKWHVGKFMRMGIFAKRNILSGEELTFNYNVDRYGNDAQTCYCGEPNCVGSIGGKTQTDLGGMDQLFIDALGISDQVDQMEAKGTRRKKSRHLDEDFTPLLRPIEEDEVAKVITAVRQATGNRNILQKLLSRIHMTQDSTVQRCLVRLHGFVLMAGVIEEWKDDKEVVLLAMGSLARWPLMARNKVVDSGVDRLVQNLSEGEDAEISSLASDLLTAWDTLELSYRIARKEVSTNSDVASTTVQDRRRGQEEEEIAMTHQSMTLEDARAPNSVSNRLDTIAPKLMGQGSSRSLYGQANGPRIWKASTSLESPTTPRTPDEHRGSHQALRGMQPNGKPRGVGFGGAHAKTGPTFAKAPSPPKAVAPTPMSIEEIIRKANESEAAMRRQAEEVATAAMEKAKAEAEAAEKRRAEREREGGKGKRRLSGSSRSNGDKRARGSEEEVSMDVLERRLKKLVGEVVVRYMSHYKDELDREVFKRHAKELTKLVCGKEMRTSHSWPPSDGLTSGLSTEKQKKIKAFVKDYTLKLIARKGTASQGAGKGQASMAGSSGVVDTKSTESANGKALPSKDQPRSPRVGQDDDDDEAPMRMSDDEHHDGIDQDHHTTSVSPSAMSASLPPMVVYSPHTPPCP